MAMIECFTCWDYYDKETLFSDDQYGLIRYREHIHSHETQYWANVGIASEFADFERIVYLRLDVMEDWANYGLHTQIQGAWAYDFALIQLIDDAINEFYNDIKNQLGGGVGYDDTWIKGQISKLWDKIDTAVDYNDDWIHNKFFEIEELVETGIIYDDRDIRHDIAVLEDTLTTLGAFTCVDLVDDIKDIERDIANNILPQIKQNRDAIYDISKKVTELEQTQSGSLWDLIRDILEAIFGGVDPDDNEISAWMEQVDDDIDELWDMTFDLVWAVFAVVPPNTQAQIDIVWDEMGAMERDITDRLWALEQREISGSEPGPAGPRGPAGAPGSVGPPGAPGERGPAGPKATLTEVDSILFNALAYSTREGWTKITDIIEYTYWKVKGVDDRLEELRLEFEAFVSEGLTKRVKDIEDELQAPELLLAEIAGIDPSRWEAVVDAFRTLIAKILSTQG